MNREAMQYVLNRMNEMMLKRGHITEKEFNAIEKQIRALDE